MATKAQKAEERMRVIQDARKSIASIDDFEIGFDPTVAFSPDGYWVQAWIKFHFRLPHQRETDRRSR